MFDRLIDAIKSVWCYFLHLSAEERAKVQAGDYYECPKCKGKWLRETN